METTSDVSGDAPHDNEEVREENRWLKQKLQKRMDEMRFAFQEETNRLVALQKETESELHKTSAELRTLEKIVDKEAQDQLQNQLKLLLTENNNMRSDVAETRALQAQVIELLEFKKNVLEVWETADDISTFGAAAKKYCQNMIDAEAMDPLLPNLSAEERERLKVEARASRSSLFKNVIQRVIVAGRGQKEIDEDGHIHLDTLAEEAVLSQDDTSLMARAHSTLRIERENKILMEHLEARKVELELIATKLGMKKEATLGGKQAVMRALGNYKAKASAEKARKIEADILANKEKLEANKGALKAARFQVGVTKSVAQKFKNQLEDKTKEMLSLEKKVRDIQRKLKAANQETIELTNERDALLEHSQFATHTAGLYKDKTPVSHKKNRKNHGGGLKHHHAHGGNRYTVKPKEKGQRGRGSGGNSPPPHNYADPNVTVSTEEAAGMENVDSLIGVRDRNDSSILDDYVQSSENERKSITRWVLPVFNPSREEQDKISTTFGGIPWNRLDLCCKNSLLEYGRGNQRGLGHQMTSPGRSLPSKNSIEMGKNMLSRGVL